MKVSTAVRSPAQTVSTTDESISQAVSAGVAMQTVDDVEYGGRHIEVEGRKLLNFGGCSYLGLEQRPELKRGAIQAVERFGTQFSFSRVYLQSPLYPQLEEALGRVTGGHVLVAASTTLAHISALPVLVEPGDAVLIDRFAHASLHTAAGLLHSIPVHPVRHSRIDLIEEAIGRLAKMHRHVWYVLDGLYSMAGDFAPLEEIAALRDKYPQLRLYIDDAHSTSWFGQNGRGYALDTLTDRRGVVVALSLNKAFSAGGGALVFATDEDRMKVRRGGGPMLFSGPLQPPLLGAALASAELHLSTEFSSLQRGLMDRIERAHALASQLGLKFASEDHTPIFFIRIGAENHAIALAKAMQDQGLYVCVSVFPAVARNQAGVRFTISSHNTPADIERLMGALAREMTRLGVSMAPEGHSAATPNESGVRTALRRDGADEKPSSTPPVC
jgi:7-keto-8-aminopelargonate synthetase-like enzyme